MKHGHGKNSGLPTERQKRRMIQRKAGHSKERQNQLRALRGGQPNELGVTQGQNGELGNTTDMHSLRDTPHISH
jgi:hypothetical protein